MTVYAVNAIHTPWVSHGYEPIAMFSTREKAEADAARRTAAIDPSADPEHTGIYEYTVEEWTVDDDAPESA